MTASSDPLVEALRKWQDSRQEWECAKVQLTQAEAAQVPPLAMALLKVQVDSLEARTTALFETAMTFMERRPLGP